MAEATITFNDLNGEKVDDNIVIPAGKGLSINFENFERSKYDLEFQVLNEDSSHFEPLINFDFNEAGKYKIKVLIRDRGVNDVKEVIEKSVMVKDFIIDSVNVNDVYWPSNYGIPDDETLDIYFKFVSSDEIFPSIEHSDKLTTLFQSDTIRNVHKRSNVSFDLTGSSVPQVGYGSKLNYAYFLVGLYKNKEYFLSDNSSSQTLENLQIDGDNQFTLFRKYSFGPYSSVSIFSKFQKD